MTVRHHFGGRCWQSACGLLVSLGIWVTIAIGLADCSGDCYCDDYYYGDCYYDDDYCRDRGPDYYGDCEPG
jgi:hypothetical protein